MTRLLSILLILVVSACTAAPAPPAPEPGDPTVVAADHYSVMFENDAVRILKVTYAPGTSSVLHRHPEGVAVILSGSAARFTGPDGTTEEMNPETDSALYMPAAAHSVENIGDTPIDVVLVEFKPAMVPSATLPTEFNGRTATILDEGPRATAFKVTADPSFTEPAGSTHDYDQVVIALGSGDVALTIDGTLVKSSWVRGDAQFIGRAVPHGTTNTLTGPLDYVLVGIR
jgi:quercetin dioxygenase-like cupin family protein